MITVCSTVGVRDSWAASDPTIANIDEAARPARSMRLAAAACRRRRAEPGFVAVMSVVVLDLAAGIVLRLVDFVVGLVVAVIATG